MPYRSTLTAAIVTATGLIGSANAGVETFENNFDNAIRDGFTLSGDFNYPGGQYPAFNSDTASHSITYNGSFTFESLALTSLPFDWCPCGPLIGLDMTVHFFDSQNTEITEADIAFPDYGQHFVYSNSVANVHEILFDPTQTFFPSFYDLTYIQTTDVPEPASLRLLGALLAGLGLIRAATRTALANARTRPQRRLIAPPQIQTRRSCCSSAHNCRSRNSNTGSR